MFDCRSNGSFRNAVLGRRVWDRRLVLNSQRLEVLLTGVAGEDRVVVGSEALNLHVVLAFDLGLKIPEALEASPLVTSRRQLQSRSR